MWYKGNSYVHIVSQKLGIYVHRTVLGQEIFRFSRFPLTYLKFSVARKLTLVLLKKLRSLLIPNCHISINQPPIKHLNRLHFFRRKIKVHRTKEKQSTPQISRHAVTLRQISMPMIIYLDSKCTSIMG